MCKQIGNLCSNCKTDSLDVIEEDEAVIYLHCSNCDLSDEIYKTSRDNFIEAVEDNYCFEDVLEYADEHFENLLPMKENIDNFVEWVEMKFE